MGTDDDQGASGTLAAGDFSRWLASTRAAIRGEQDADVPCGTCSACCTSSQFVHIAPDEVDTLAHVPAELTFPAPRLPKGHVLLGYDERGNCPMLVEGACSIYEHRPRTCRTYDCRVFPAAGLDPGAEGEHAGIAARSRRWRFDHPSGRDVVEHAAVGAAATFLEEHAHELPAEVLPPTTTQRAVAALQLHDVFVREDGTTGSPVARTPELAEVRVRLLDRAPRR